MEQSIKADGYSVNGEPTEKLSKIVGAYEETIQKVKSKDELVKDLFDKAYKQEPATTANVIVVEENKKVLPHIVERSKGYQIPSIITPDMKQEEEPSLDELIKGIPEAIDDISKLPAFDFEDIKLYGDTIGILVYKKRVSVFTDSSASSKTGDIKLSFRSIIAKVGDECSRDVRVGDKVALINELITNPRVEPLSLLPVKKTADKEYFLAVFPSHFLAVRL